MLTETEQFSIRETFRQLWPEAGTELLSLVGGMSQAGCRLILFNLPINYKLDKGPSDLDLCLDKASYEAARVYLLDHGALRMTHRPGTDQSLYLLRLSGGSWFRIHLHLDFSFMGVKLATFAQMKPYCFEHERLFLPGPELDYFLLHMQWFFKRKSNYSIRIEPLREQIKRDQHEPLVSGLTTRVARLYQRTIDDCRNGRAVIGRYKLSVAFSQLGWLWPMMCAAVSKVGEKIASLIPGRRRGLFVYLMGIDGTGKTSLAKRLVGSHKTGLIADYAYLGLKITLVQKVRSRLLGQNERERFDGQSGVADKLATKSSFLANLFNLVLAFFYIADYAARTYITLRFVRRDNNLLVVDRGYYDKLTERQKWGNGLFYTLLPKPDLVIGLTGDIPTLYARKREFEPEILAKMQIKMDQVWEFLANQNIPFRRIDTTQNDPEKCVRLMNEKIWQAIKPDL